MAGPFLEDFFVGQTLVGGPLTVTQADIVGFAREYDAQPFHLDEEAARKTFAGRLIASGWHTAALGMRLLQAGPFQGRSSLGSPGITELRWLAPVLPGDALGLSLSILETRTSSKPGRGFVRCTLALANQRGETVLTQGFSFMVPQRGAEPPPPPAITETTDLAPVPEPTDAEIMPFLGDAQIGQERDLGSYRFTQGAIVAFAEAYDPQVFHVDPVAARDTLFGGLIASGWHTAGAYMQRLLVTRARDYAYTGARGPAPLLGPSPGFRNMRWLAPVRVGDTLRYRTRLTDKRASASRPGWGLAFAHNSAVNQRGEPVFAFDSTVFWQWAP